MGNSSASHPLPWSEAGGASKCKLKHYCHCGVHVRRWEHGRMISWSVGRFLSLHSNLLPLLSLSLFFFIFFPIPSNAVVCIKFPCSIDCKKNILLTMKSNKNDIINTKPVHHPSNVGHNHMSTRKKLEGWRKIRWYLFSDWIEKIKIFNFFYSVKVTF